MITFNSIENAEIFTRDFRPLVKNNVITFPSTEEIVAIYGPNGTGKTRLTSKKTLINEFNHFEGNLSIFQPAIDITDHALGNERTDVVTFVSSL